MEVSNEVRVKDEPIYDSQSFSDTRKATLRSNKPNNITNNDWSIKHERQFIPISESKRTREDISIDDEEKPNKRKKQSMKIKEEPIDNETQTSKEIFIKAEEKFSATKELAYKTSIQTVSIAFLNKDETSTTTSDINPTTSINQPNNPRKTTKNNLKKSK